MTLDLSYYLEGALEQCEDKKWGGKPDACVYNIPRKQARTKKVRLEIYRKTNKTGAMVRLQDAFSQLHSAWANISIS